MGLDSPKPIPKFDFVKGFGYNGVDGLRRTHGYVCHNKYQGVLIDVSWTGVSVYSVV